MYQQWLKFLEFLGSIRLPHWSGKITAIAVGNPNSADVMGSTSWKSYTKSEALYQAWSPHQNSPWLPFHCITLFAAIEKFTEPMIGPRPFDMSNYKVALNDPVPSWATSDTLVMVDLPGAESVAVAAWLATRAGFQTVCTFDNWPHQKGLVKPEVVLGTLLYFAPLMADHQRNIAVDAPPLWICDRDRLGTRKGRPSEFDNRYFLDDSVLPGPINLKKAGITKIIYLCPNSANFELPDLSLYFQLLLKEGFELKQVGIADKAELFKPTPLIPQKIKLSKGGFFRSSAGGFGAPIPEPSSSSG